MCCDPERAAMPGFFMQMRRMGLHEIPLREAPAVLG